jgi:hypothetical protein
VSELSVVVAFAVATNEKVLAKLGTFENVSPELMLV